MSNIKTLFSYAFKDLNQHRVRTVIGTIGVMISVALLAIVLFLSDSISVTFIDYLSIDAGGQDFNVSVRHYNGEPASRSNFFYYDPIIETIRTSNDDIDAYFPRFNLWGNLNASKGLSTQELSDEIYSAFISGINFSLEKNYNFGNFIVPSTNQILELTNLSLYHCAIFYEFNKDIKYAENDVIEVRMGLTHNGTNFQRIHNFTIDKIFDYQLKWPIGFRNRPLIVVDISTLYSIFGIETFEGLCNELILTLKASEIYYDARDIEGSENRVKDIAAEIQLAVGINEYNVELPKLEVLGFSEFLSVGITIIFVFVSMISMIISGVLINGILKTSVEERIREFGIFRTLGAKKRFNLYIVLLQGILLCGLGTILGIIVGYLVTQFVILPIAEIIVAGIVPGLTGNIAFSVTPWSIIISLVIGISVGLAVSIAPAAKVMRLQLIESIHPYRKEDVLYKLEKRASVNYKLIITGIILALNGGFVLLIIPRIITSGSISLIAGTLIALLIIFLIGTTLAGLGIIPLIIRFFITIFKFFSQKLAPVYRIFIFRYARRNFSTIVIFAFTFSFVIFTAGAFRFLSDQGSISSNLRYGADIVIETEGWYEPEEAAGFNGGFFGGGGFQSTTSIQIQQEEFSVNPERILTEDFKSTLLSIPGIERVSTVIANPFQLTQIYSEEGKEFLAEIGDYAGLSTIEISLIGIDEEYSSTIKTQYIEFTQGDLSSSFDQLFQNGEPLTCIISEALSSTLNLFMGDIIRMVVQRGDESQIYTFKVVGVSASMPGFFTEFGRSGSSANMGGVMISQQTYISLMDIPPIPYLDKLFVKVSPSSQNAIQDIILKLEEENRDSYDFDIIDLQQTAGQQQSYFTILDTFFSMTLDATIVICLFGLISSSYSTIIERKKEIGIIRTLGLKGKDINRLFTIESLIIMLSSGTIGVIVGWCTGLLLSTSVNLLSDLPNLPVFPLSNMVIVFAVSIIFTLIGMKLLLKKSRKKKIVEIYRETM